MRLIIKDLIVVKVDNLLKKSLEQISPCLEPSGFIAHLGGGFRRKNIHQMKPMVGRKVVDTISKAQAKVKSQKYP